MYIDLFGASTQAASYFLSYYSDFPIRINSRNITFNTSHQRYVDLSDPQSFCISRPKHDSLCFISFAPITLFAQFIEYLSYKTPSYLRSLKGIVVCSSTSAVTKYYSVCSFDRSLAESLTRAESTLKSVCDFQNIPCIVLRPTMLYDNVGTCSDKVLSAYICFMRISPFIFLPSTTGTRQPLHYSQLAQLSIYKLRELLSITRNVNPSNSPYFKVINVGGDYELSYMQMLRLVKQHLPRHDFAHLCLFIIIPPRLFVFLVSPIALISPKLYEALRRISCNLSGFTTISSIINTSPVNFPLFATNRI